MEAKKSYFMFALVYPRIGGDFLCQQKKLKTEMPTHYLSTHGPIFIAFISCAPGKTVPWKLQ